MPFEHLKKFNSINEYIEKQLLPELRKNYQVIVCKKVGDQYFFLAQQLSEPKSKFVMAYTITKAALGSNGIIINSHFLGCSLQDWTNLLKCPNYLLSRIERNIELHEKFIEACLQHQKNMEAEFQLRPEKYELLLKTEQRAIIKNKSGEKVRFMGLHSTKKYKLWGVYLGTKKKVMISLDDFDLQEVKKASKKSIREK